MDCMRQILHMLTNHPILGAQAAGSIEDLRAIPWIFAWTQTRLHLPVWLGIGGAFKVHKLFLPLKISVNDRLVLRLSM